MPHQCIRCGKTYPEGSEALLKGCSCGARFFFFFREKMPEKIAEIQNIPNISSEPIVSKDAFISDLTKEERKDIINEIKEIVGNTKETIALDLESIKAVKPGKYEINLISLFNRKPVIYKHGEGKYVIDVDSTFKLMRRK